MRWTPDATTTSIVVVAYDMGRELPRTIETLSASHQRGVDPDGLEVIVVDNGSPVPVQRADLPANFAGKLRIVRESPATHSPVGAANTGLALAGGDLVGLFVDGARMASPGLVAGARRAASLHPRAVVTAAAYHLGEVPHMRAHDVGYDQTVEDRLLADVPWRSDGYSLFPVSTLAGSSGRGIFGVKGESNSLFMSRPLWDEVGGMDPAFTLPGGGLANHDLYGRACALPEIELFELLGEGTFHQFHGGAATSRRFSFEEMQDDHRTIRGRRHEPPTNEATYLGRVNPAVVDHVAHSARMAANRAASAR